MPQQDPLWLLQLQEEVVVAVPAAMVGLVDLLEVEDLLKAKDRTL